MAKLAEFRPLAGSERPHPRDHRKLHPTDPAAELTFTVVLRRHAGHTPVSPQNVRARAEMRPARDAFIAARGADTGETETVVDFLKNAGLQVIDADQARRSVVAHGNVAAVDRLFEMQLNDYEYAKGTYRGHDGAVNIPAAISDYVEAVIGLTNRKIEAKHWPTATVEKEAVKGVPPKTVPLTPAQVASLYEFPAGDGAGQTIALYEMQTGNQPQATPRRTLKAR